MGCSNPTPLFFFLCLAMATTVVLGQGTRAGFYSSSCPRAESIVESTVRNHFNANPAIAPGLLRMHFHDCFVLGCDGSVLIDGPDTERTGIANSNLRGFEVVEDAKTQLEAECPGIVSCADILALAARDSVVLTNGPSWSVPTGRRDGRVSLASDTIRLPVFNESVDIQKQKFAEKGLDTKDLVTLVGGHTIGTTACAFFSYRLFNFNNTGAPDPSISSTFLPALQELCPENGNGTKRVGLDNGSDDLFDTSYFLNLARRRGVLESDQMLWTDGSTRNIVEGYLGITGFIRYSFEFGNSMVKMSNIEVKTGTDGEIRQVCSAINPVTLNDDSRTNIFASSM